MNVLFPTATVNPVAPASLASDPAAAIYAAALLLLPHLERGQRIDTADLRAAMEASFGRSDASGAWDWKTAYDACEAATVLFLRKYGKSLLRKAGSPACALPLFGKIGELLPTHTRRSEESQAFQQFSTPIPLGFAAVAAAAITPTDRVLEPSAGTGLLAILGAAAGGSLVLNELAEIRAGLLSTLFPALTVTRFDAAQIDDHLDPAIMPTVVLMNPPFSVLANVKGRAADAAYRHVTSALARLADGGRLVTLTGANFGPETPAWRDAFIRLQEHSRVVFTATIGGSVYAKHGTTIETRLTVIDKVAAGDSSLFPASAGLAPDVATLLGWIDEHVPARLPVPDQANVVPTIATSRTVRGYLVRDAAVPARPQRSKLAGVELAYETVDWTPDEGARLTDAIYEEYGSQTIRIPGSQAHPTKLVQSAAMASVAPPKPSYRPTVPSEILKSLSEAQLETLILAGEAHAGFLAGSWSVDDTFDIVNAAPEDAEGAVRFRRGFFIGDGTGLGKGRQAASIVLDNWLQGRRKAVWISKSDKCLRTLSATGRHSAWNVCWSPRCRVSLEAAPSRCRKASCLQPMPRCAPTTAGRRFRASGRSSNGWAPSLRE